MQTLRSLARFWLARPWLDAFSGLERCLLAGGKGLAWVAAGLFTAYLVYVPLHELAHAFACLAAGGEVTRLEIRPIFGGHLLARLFPWVVPGGEYAGRLSGFDTRGSDLVYLATDLGPFVLTVLPGVWWLRKAARGRRAFLFGASLPVALAPFLSLTGDAYEIGSILVTRVSPWSEAASRMAIRGDDVFKVFPALAGQPALVWIGALAAAVVGVAWAFLTCALGGGVASRAGQPALATDDKS